ncbi:MAG TPA: hypothetical protein ENI17_08460 [Pseudomonas xinjiangensis]|uniref:Outer membrane protein TolC n=2 Tax=root TaxID=1 RepID=A0A7V1BPY0_9GAMM|nr:hypothetical protein [Halopseudomonas xinjiangensis]HEC47647.1 hypothetical protein [Halopseudomonas xinjiangensis]
MKHNITRARFCAAALLVGSLGSPGLSVALTLEQALILAEREAPSLAAQAANRQAALSAAIPAGELPDPKLRLGLQNVPIEGESRWRLGNEPMTMQMVGVMQDVPNRDKRRARVDAAEAAVALAGVQHTIELLQVRQQAAEAWIATLAVERKLALFQQLYEENELFSRVVTARLAGGRGQITDSVLPKQEAALLADEEDLLLRNETVARAELRRWVGVAASQSLTGDWPQWQDDFAHYQHNLSRHPQLLAFEPMERKAQAEIAQAVAEKTPDWGWGVDYQRRGRGFGDMVSLSVSFDLPVFAGSRQDPNIAAERARLAQIEAEREAVLREHNQVLLAGLAEFQRLERGLARLEQTLMPLAEEKVQLAMADYRAGSGELTSVIDARRQLVETRLRRIDLARDRSLINARLHFAFGDTQP